VPPGSGAACSRTARVPCIRTTSWPMTGRPGESNGCRRRFRRLVRQRFPPARSRLSRSSTGITTRSTDSPGPATDYVRRHRRRTRSGDRQTPCPTAVVDGAPPPSHVTYCYSAGLAITAIGCAPRAVLRMLARRGELSQIRCAPARPPRSRRKRQPHNGPADIDSSCRSWCRDAAKIERKRRSTLTRFRRVAGTCQSSLHEPSSGPVPLHHGVCAIGVRRWGWFSTKPQVNT
jgi:hypothetical protein